MMSTTPAQCVRTQMPSINHRHIAPANVVAFRKPVGRTSKRVSMMRAPLRVRAEGVGSEGAKPASKEVRSASFLISNWYPVQCRQCLLDRFGVGFQFAVARNHALCLCV